jgi:transposase
VRASEHDRPDIRAARHHWQAIAPTLDPARLVFLDESGVTTNLLRRYGRSLRGQRVTDHTPQGRWQTSTFIAALRVHGLTAPGVFDGPMDGESFFAYVDQILVPTLHAGDIVVADNLPAHRVDGIDDRIAAAGAELWYLPPYSPDFNPIELCFAKLKAILRAARCRSTETLWPLLGDCLTRFSAAECRNYFRHCGYRGR